MDLTTIDYQKLKLQKDIFIRMIQDWRESDDPLQNAESLEAEGLLNLIDSIQDNAITDLNLTEKEVFNLQKL